MQRRNRALVSERTSGLKWAAFFAVPPKGLHTANFTGGSKRLEPGRAKTVKTESGAQS